MLGHAEVSCVQKTPRDSILVLAFRACARRQEAFNGLEATRVPGWESELSDKEVEVRARPVEQKAPNVLKNEGLWMNYPNCTNDFVKHVPAIVGSEKEPPLTERLTRRAC
jgi:hypothetical protein